MERLVTLKNKAYLKELVNYGIKGIITGSPAFSSRYKFDLHDLEDIDKECKALGLDLYISLDTMVEERDLTILNDYLEYIRTLNVKGIYYADLAVLEMAQAIKLDLDLIYDPGSIMTNSLDASFYIKEGNKAVVAARELTFEEVLKMAKTTKGHVDMQIFGYIKASTSKRKFLTNYFKHINKDFNPHNLPNLRIVEETRDYDMPIIENNFGTQIYNDYVLCTYAEYQLIKENIRHAIIDDIFLSEEELFTVLKDYQKLDQDMEADAKALEEALQAKFPKRIFDKAYLYQKTNIMK